MRVALRPIYVGWTPPVPSVAARTTRMAPDGPTVWAILDGGPYEPVFGSELAGDGAGDDTSPASLLRSWSRSSARASCSTMVGGCSVSIAL